MSVQASPTRRAMVAAEAQAACERFVHEFEYDEDPAMQSLVAHARKIAGWEIRLDYKPPREETHGSHD